MDFKISTNVDKMSVSLPFCVSYRWIEIKATYYSLYVTDKAITSRNIDRPNKLDERDGVSIDDSNTHSTQYKNQ